MAEQKVVEIEISSLHLWTENPRDPIDPTALDVDVIKNAITNNRKKWNLEKLLKEMGDYYDFSDIPIVVERDRKFIVYDGNRRIALLKYIQNPEIYSEISGRFYLKDTMPPELMQLRKLPCNICDEETALASVERKHVNNGSWQSLERDYFAHYHLRRPKSDFLIIEEATHLIENNPSMNKRYVRDEVLTKENLNDIGFEIAEGKLASNYNDEKSKEIFRKVVDAVSSKKITTRKNRYQLRKALEENQGTDSEFKKFDRDAPILEVHLEDSSNNTREILRKTPRSRKGQTNLFGGTLSLVAGNTNDIYRDIFDLDQFYIQKSAELSKSFPALIRMSLRLLVESAAKESNSGTIAKYIQDNHDEAKESLTQNEKTLLSAQSVASVEKIIELLQAGAHSYISSSNYEQTLAISIILGKMLEKTCGK